MLKRARFCCELCGVSGINSGEAAGQTVFHCHLHLIAAARGLGAVRGGGGAEMEGPCAQGVDFEERVPDTGGEGAARAGRIRLAPLVLALLR